MAASFELPDRIEDEVVALRPLRPDDIAAYAASFVADPALGAALGRETDPTADDLADWPRRTIDAAAAGEFVELAIADPADNLLGSVVMHSPDHHHERIEIGFWLTPAARGRGLARRAVALAVDWAFTGLGMHRVEMTTLPELDRALALADRLGFRREGIMRERNFERGRRLDVVMLGLLREDWERRG